MSLRNDKGSPLSRIISPNNSSCSKSLSIVSANITIWQYTNMRDGLVANMGIYKHERWISGHRGYFADPPSCRSYRGYVEFPRELRQSLCKRSNYPFYPIDLCRLPNKSILLL